jgi:hypothetical protein
MPSTSQTKTFTTKTNRIIGGLIGLEIALHNQKVPPLFLTDRDLFLVNARSGIWLLVNQIRPLQVWIPSFLCYIILEAIDPQTTVRRFYEVDKGLKIISDQWVSEVQEGDLVIFIDYFGFPYDRHLGAHVKERGAWVLEDAVQALLSPHVGGISDFVIFSFRKWVGVPDGAILRVPEGSPLRKLVLDIPSTHWWLKAFQTTVLRREFDDGVPTRKWLKLFRETEDTGPIGPYVMSHLSRAIVEASVDYSMTTNRRIKNYKTLLCRLEAYSLFPHIDPDVVPLGFPVRVANRDVVRQVLFDHKIYPPVHWPIERVVPAELIDSHRLAKEIMTFPCDQRYNAEDMERMAEVFLKHAIPSR